MHTNITYRILDEGDTQEFQQAVTQDVSRMGSGILLMELPDDIRDVRPVGNGARHSSFRNSFCVAVDSRISLSISTSCVCVATRSIFGSGTAAQQRELSLDQYDYPFQGEAIAVWHKRFRYR